MINPKVKGPQFDPDLGEEVIAYPYKANGNICSLNETFKCPYHVGHPQHGHRKLCSQRDCEDVSYLTKLDYLDAKVQGLL